MALGVGVWLAVGVNGSGVVVGVTVAVLVGTGVGVIVGVGVAAPWKKRYRIARLKSRSPPVTPSPQNHGFNRRSRARPPTNGAPLSAANASCQEIAGRSTFSRRTGGQSRATKRQAFWLVASKASKASVETTSYLPSPRLRSSDKACGSRASSGRLINKRTLAQAAPTSATSCLDILSFLASSSSSADTSSSTSLDAMICIFLLAARAGSLANSCASSSSCRCLSTSVTRQLKSSLRSK